MVSLYEMWRRVAIVAVMCGAAVAGRRASGQCGATFVAHHGGETTAVAQVQAGVILAARGTMLELVFVQNPASPTLISPATRIALDSPAVRVATTVGGSRAYVVQADGSILVASVSTTTLARLYRIEGDFRDVVADGSRLYAVEYGTGFHNDNGSGRIRLVDASGTTSAANISSVSPQNAGYQFDRIVKVGTQVWAGFHEYQSSILGVDGFEFATPNAPTRIVTSLNNAAAGTFTDISAMAAIGTRLFVTYRTLQSGGNEDWMRAVDVTTPSSPQWRTPVDLNSDAENIGVVGNQLHVAVGDAGVSVWDAGNPNAMTWLGTYDIQAGVAHDVVSVANTDFVAAGPAQMVALNSTNPASMSVRSSFGEFPSRPISVRTSGTTTVTLDAAWGWLRLFDYTQPEGSQSRGIAFVSAGDDLLELSVQPGGKYACVAGGGTLRIVDINNAGSPSIIATMNLGSSIRMLAVFGNRAYTFDESATLKVIDLTNPSVPVVRSSNQYGGTGSDYTALAAWSNTVALGSRALGLWLIDTTTAAAPQVRSVWNPGNSYYVSALCKGPTNLFVGATTTAGVRLETLDITNLNAPTLAWRRENPVGGRLRRIDALTYVQNSTNRFLVSTAASGVFVPIMAELTFFDLSNAQVPVPVAELDAWGVRNPGPSVNADGTRMYAGGHAGGVHEIAVPTQWAPGFVVEPVDRSACLGGSVLFGLGFPAVSANPSSGVTLRWYRNGAPLSDGPTGWGSTISGSTGFLNITGLHPQDAGATVYACAATNSCGGVFSRSVRVLMCAPDFNCSGTLTVQDIFDFLTAWFAGTSAANYNGVNGLGVQDIFDFLEAWFAGCG